MINILVTLNSTYIPPLCTMLRSLAVSNSNEAFNIYVAYCALTDEDFKKIEYALSDIDAEVYPIKLDDALFEKAPSKKRISKETYYRMFAPLYLPKSVDRILYIDPDTVVINPLKSFYQTDFGGNYIIGAKHFDGAVDKWNRGRLGIKNSPKYINAGIMLLNIREMRKDFSSDKIFSLINRYHRILFLADQDAINILYDGKIKTFTEYKINLDERSFNHLLKHCSLEDALEFVETNTIIVHFNGKYKPWKDDYKGNLKEFYDRYRSNPPIKFKARCFDEGA